MNRFIVSVMILSLSGCGRWKGDVRLGDANRQTKERLHNAGWGSQNAVQMVAYQEKSEVLKQPAPSTPITQAPPPVTEKESFVRPDDSGALEFLHFPENDEYCGSDGRYGLPYIGRERSYVPERPLDQEERLNQMVLNLLLLRLLDEIQEQDEVLPPGARRLPSGAILTPLGPQEWEELNLPPIPRNSTHWKQFEASDAENPKPGQNFSVEMRMRNSGSMPWVPSLKEGLPPEIPMLRSEDSQEKDQPKRDTKGDYQLTPRMSTWDYPQTGDMQPVVTQEQKKEEKKFESKIRPVTSNTSFLDKVATKRDIAMCYILMAMTILCSAVAIVLSLKKEMLSESSTPIIATMIIIVLICMYLLSTN